MAKFREAWDEGHRGASMTWLMRSIGRDGGGLGNKSEPWCIYIDMEGFSALYAKEGQILCHSVK
jgi:hypothetical protein